jgi:hypothetical protein
MKALFIVSYAAAVAALRLDGVTTQAFQAVAHMFVYGMFVAWRLKAEYGRVCLAAGLAVTAVEAYCFLKTQLGF